MQVDIRPTYQDAGVQCDLQFSEHTSLKVDASVQCDIEYPLFVSTPRIDYYSTSESESDAPHGTDTSTGMYHPLRDIQSSLSQVYMTLCVCIHIATQNLTMESVVSNLNGTPGFSFRSDEPDSTDSSYTWKGQTIYLVFESALLLLFSSCIHCSSHTSVKKVVLGSFLRIIQICSHCNRRRTWESQPYNYREIASWKYFNICCHSLLWSTSI